MRLRLSALVAALSCLTVLAALPATAGGEPAAKPLASDMASPRDAGIRYGQAAGMAAACENMHPTEKADALAKSFSGADLEAFNVQAETILQSWKKTISCSHTSDPNPCRLAHEMSCREGLKEIGPGGTIAPGLVEVVKR